MFFLDQRGITEHLWILTNVNSSRENSDNRSAVAALPRYDDSLQIFSREQFPSSNPEKNKILVKIRVFSIEINNSQRICEGGRGNLGTTVLIKPKYIRKCKCISIS